MDFDYKKGVPWGLHAKTCAFAHVQTEVPTSLTVEICFSFPGTCQHCIRHNGYWEKDVISLTSVIQHVVHMVRAVHSKSGGGGGGRAGRQLTCQ